MRDAFYFGYKPGAGHWFQLRDGRSTLEAVRLVPDFPEAWDRLMDTGLLKNRGVPDVPDGRVHWTCARPDWHAFVWWDRSGDKRGACNSAFYTRGFDPLMRPGRLGIQTTALEAFQFACARWPGIVARQLFPLTLQEVP